jgi:Uma2 family endonuclease
MTLCDFVRSKYYHDGGWELMRGELVAMSPARVTHEFLVIRLGHLLQNRIDEHRKTCRVGGSNAAVLYGNDSCVMPDAFVSRDVSRIDENERLIIAPEIVIEILSKSTGKYDRTMKLSLYKDAGANEYWVVDPDNKTVAVHYFGINNGMNKGHIFCMGDMVVSKFLDIQCFLVDDVFKV